MTIRWRELPGLAEALDAAGIRVWGQDGAHHSTDDTRAQAIIDAYDPLPEVQRRRLAELAAYRYEREVGGVTIDGVRWDTDRTARSNLQGAAVLAMLAQQGGRDDFAVEWKMLDGTFRMMTGQQIIELGLRVGEYVAACFEREAALRAEILAATDWREVQQIDITTNWPE